MRVVGHGLREEEEEEEEEEEGGGWEGRGGGGGGGRSGCGRGTRCGRWQCTLSAGRGGGTKQSCLSPALPATLSALCLRFHFPCVLLAHALSLTEPSPMCATRSNTQTREMCPM